MFLFRIFGVLVAIAIVSSIAAFFISRDVRYLRFSWHLFRYAILAALLFFILLILENAAIINL